MYKKTKSSLMALISIAMVQLLPWRNLNCATTTTAFVISSSSSLQRQQRQQSSITTLTRKRRLSTQQQLNLFRQKTGGGSSSRDVVTDDKDPNDQDEWIQVDGTDFLSSNSAWNANVQQQQVLEIEQRPLITTVSTLQEFKSQVVEASETLVCVKFYAPWCRSCRAMEGHYRRLARRYRDSASNIKFVQVAVTPDNALLHQGLGVPSVPFGHIYHKEAGLVEEVKLKKQDFQHFRYLVETYLAGQCELNSSEEKESSTTTTRRNKHYGTKTRF